jgi:sigma-B regulation protein RsbQ
VFAASHRVVLFDHIGAGRSDLAVYDSERYSTLQGYAQDVLAICEAMDLHDVTLVGHSVSANIALLAAIEQPERFRQLVLVAPSPSYVDDPGAGYVGGFTASDIDELLESLDSNYFAWAAATAPMVMGNPQSPELGERLAGSFCRTDPDIAREFAAVTFRSDIRDRLASVATPALILQCSADALAPTEVGDYLHAQLPDSILVNLAATGHCPHVSAPEETSAAIRLHLLATV